MPLLSRLFTRRADPRETWRPLWHQVVATSREREWYADCGAEDSIEGRFDMIALVLSLVMLRMERSDELAPPTAYLTELFVADMDRQLRDTGVGDLMVGKNITSLMGAVAGQLGALREATGQDEVALAAVLERNMHLSVEGPPMALAQRVRELHDQLAAQDDGAIAEGRLRPGSAS